MNGDIGTTAPSLPFALRETEGGTERPFLAPHSGACSYTQP